LTSRVSFLQQQITNMVENDFSTLTEAQKLDVLRMVSMLANPKIRTAATRIAAVLVRLHQAEEIEIIQAADAAWVQVAQRAERELSAALAGEPRFEGALHA